MSNRPNLTTAKPGDHHITSLRGRAATPVAVRFLFVQRVHVDPATGLRTIECSETNASLSGGSYGTHTEHHAATCTGCDAPLRDSECAMNCNVEPCACCHRTDGGKALCDCATRCKECGRTPYHCDCAQRCPGCKASTEAWCEREDRCDEHEISAKHCACAKAEAAQ